jgi:predicted ribosomally synthesized peptide with SipW-like signal peptide
MAEHRAVRTRRRLGSVRVRVLLSLGVVLGFGAVGTVAYWSDSATISGTTFSSGTLDLMVGGTTADQLAGPGGTWNHTELSISDMLPGEGVAKLVTIKNAGTTPLVYNGVISTDNTSLGSNLLATISKDGTASNTGTQAGGDRTGTCTGGTSWATDLSLTTTPQTIAPAAITLQPNDTTSICFAIGLSASTGDAFQNKSTTVTMLFTAAQP